MNQASLATGRSAYMPPAAIRSGALHRDGVYEEGLPWEWIAGILWEKAMNQALPPPW